LVLDEGQLHPGQSASAVVPRRPQATHLPVRSGEFQRRTIGVWDSADVVPRQIRHGSQMRIMPAVRLHATITNTSLDLGLMV